MPEMLELTGQQIPDDARELASVPPDGASADGSAATPGLPLQTSRRPDVEEGLAEAHRWIVEPAVARMDTMALQHISGAGLRLIESFEGFSATQYRDSVGVPTIGYGTTSADIFPLPKRCTRAQAEGWLRSKMASKYEPAIRGMGVPLNGHEFDACCSIGYNLGPGVFSSSFTLGRLLRSHQFARAADAFLLYDHAGGVVLAGLARRRREERQLFLEPMPTPADPHHLLRSPNVTYTIGGHRINERATLAKWYQLMEHKQQNTRQLKALMPSLVLLRKRVWAVSHMQHPPSWGDSWRGWRWQELNRITSTKL